MRAAAGLDRADPLGGQRLVPHEELGVLAGEDVVRHHAERARVAERAAEREDERGLPAPHRAAHAHGEGAPAEMSRGVARARRGRGSAPGTDGVVVVVAGVERVVRCIGQLWNSLE